jgi:HSP20 family protein
MADVSVKNQSSNQPSKESSKTENQQLQRQSEGRASQWRGWDPFGLSRSRGEDFFSSNPFSMMRRMSEEMDRTFGQFFGPAMGARGGTWHPAIEVAEENGQLHVHAELPGLKPEDVKVEITDDSLVIRGERKSEREHRIGSAYRSERSYGEFYREIALPEGVNADQAKAEFRNGVLEITVPVPQQASQRREIPIGTGETTGTTSSAASGQPATPGRKPATGETSGTGSSTTSSAAAGGAGQKT